jgi:predicted ATPase/class 3 adenylate cyclase
MKFCGGCAAPLKNNCPRCGFNNPPTFKFCGECGSGLTRDKSTPTASITGVRRVFGAAEADRQETGPPRDPLSYTPSHLVERILHEQAAIESRATVDGERKTITALFADIKGSMELIQDLDPEEARTIVDPVLHIMMNAVHRYEGYVAQSLGDGIFALFGAPIAQEDHPHRAVYAALRMQEDSRRYAERLRLERGVNIQIRVGINTGEVVVRSIRKDDLHTDYVPVGHSTGLAARAEALATPGSIVATEHTKRLTEGFFQFASMGKAQIKGVSSPIELFEIAGVGPLKTRLQAAARRGLARFVGRTTEMEQLRRALDLAKSGHGQVVAVMGEAGLGKSRLYYEFKLKTQTGCLLLETFSVSHGKALPYLPIVDLLRGYFGIQPGDDERQKREKVIGKVIALDRTLESVLPYLFLVVGLQEEDGPLKDVDPETKKHRTFDAVKRLLVRESRNQPLIVIFEDLHWLDEESQQFLDEFCEIVPATNTLLLVNYRPQYRHSWGSKSYYSQLRLDPLGSQHAEELLTSLIGGIQGPEELHSFILEKTQGNPFFIEEIVQSLFEDGILVREPTISLTKPLKDVQIPATVQGVLLARIDRLAPDEKALLQTLSVLGKQFSLALLRRVVDLSEEELDRLLDKLQASEFIFEQPAFPDPDYVFKHALTQEVSYKSMLAERRNVLHEGMAKAIEELYADRLEEQYSDLARHYSLSGNRPKAIDYLQRAGHQKLSQSAYTQGREQLTRALELFQTLPKAEQNPRTEILIRIDLGYALMALQGYAAPEVGAMLEKGRSLAESLGEAYEAARTLSGLSIHYLISGDIPKAQKISDELMKAARAQDRDDLLRSAHLYCGLDAHFMMKPKLARGHFEDFLSLHGSAARNVEFIPGQDPLSAALGSYGVILWILGYPDQARRRSEEAIARAQELSQPFSMALALNHAAQLNSFLGDFRKAQEQVSALVEISTKHNFRFWAVMGDYMKGLMKTGKGDRTQGLKEIEAAYEGFRSTGSGVGKWGGDMIKARAYARLGETERALDAVRESEASAREAGVEDFYPELVRVKGEVFQIVFKDDPGRAEECYHTAREIARKAGARSYELKAAIDLAQLKKEQGDNNGAREALEPIYSWFNEGLDTHDLKKARGILEELS